MLIVFKQLHYVALMLIALHDEPILAQSIKDTEEKIRMNQTLIQVSPFEMFIRIHEICVNSFYTSSPLLIQNSDLIDTHLEYSKVQNYAAAD